MKQAKFQPKYRLLMATRTVSNAGGLWNTVGTWVEGVVPANTDNVICTASSGNLTLDNPGGAARPKCLTLDFTNYVNTFDFASQRIDVFQDCKFVAGMTVNAGGASPSGQLVFQGSVTSSLTSAGKFLPVQVSQTSTNTLNLLDALNSGAPTAGGLASSGIFNSNDKSITNGANMATTGTGVMNLGASVISTRQMTLTSGTVNAGNTDITITTNGGAAFAGAAGYTFGNVTFAIAATPMTINGQNVFNGTLTIAANTLFSANQTANSVVSTGTSGVHTTLKSSVGGTVRTLTVKSTTLTFTDLTDIAFAYTKTLTGGLTSAGVIATFRTLGKILTGTLTPAGALVTFRTIRTILTGALTATGALLKQPQRVFTGVLASAGAITRVASRVMSGALTTSGTLSKAVARVLTSVLTFLGNVLTAGYGHTLPLYIASSTPIRLYCSPQNYTAGLKSGSILYAFISTVDDDQTDF